MRGLQQEKCHLFTRPVKNLKMDSDTIDIWFASLNKKLQPRYFRPLDTEEKKHAQSFRTSNGCAQYVLSRFALKNILSQYIGCKSKEIQFGFAKQGKPYLTMPLSQLEFNLSHTESVALCVIAKNKRVGIDVEMIKPLDNLDELVAFCMSNQEQAEYQTLARAEKLFFFYRIWVRKEAFLKGIGHGLNDHLKNFSVWPISNGVIPSNLGNGIDDQKRPWSISDLSFEYKGQLFQAAFTKEGVAKKIRKFQFSFS